MNPRTYEKMKKINERLEEFSQVTRIVYLTATELTLNTGVRLNGNSAARFIKRVMNKKILEWVKNTDKLLSGEVTDSEIKSISSSVGGKSCQLRHGEKLRKNLNTGTPWNQGMKGSYPYSYPCSEQTKLKISRKNSGSGNGMFGTAMSMADREKKSRVMKNKILNGEFTPKSNNRNTHWESQYNGKKYRSSWEAIYQCLNSTAEYEVLRIQYKTENNDRIYIVDFVDHFNKLVVEVKPRELCVGKSFADKMNALSCWAKEKSYSVLLVDREWLLNHPIPDQELDKFDENTRKKIESLYEINKKNRNK